jgi:hypothetical protein
MNESLHIRLFGCGGFWRLSFLVVGSIDHVVLLVRLAGLVFHCRRKLAGE